MIIETYKSEAISGFMEICNASKKGFAKASIFYDVEECALNYAERRVGRNEN